jgi:microcin C transport system ATP-binding protein
MTSMLQFRELSIRFPGSGRTLAKVAASETALEPDAQRISWAVDGLNLSIDKGDRVALVGESGSGKTITALAALGLLQDVELRGSIQWKGEELNGASPSRLRRLRGKEIAMVFQEPMSALNPLLTVGRQVGEVLETHEGLTKSQAHERAVELLQRVGIDDPSRRARSYPHQLSGGQRQRVLIAMALACQPELLIADEPTTALDVSLRQQILELLWALQDETGMAILLITHDLPIVKRFASRVAVMQSGSIIESGDAESVFQRPSHPYTQRLIQSQPRPLVGAPGPRDILLDVRQLHCDYTIPSGLFRRRRYAAVHRENFVVSRGETLGVVGESGSGKTSLAMTVMRLTSARVTGLVKLNGIDLLSLSAAALRKERRRFQPVFQDPYSALSPRLTVRHILEEGLRLHRPELTWQERLDRCESIMVEVGLEPQGLHRYPHEFSGGQRQRIAIARAVLQEPELIILDEPTSALDLSIQQQILELLVNLQETKGFAYLFISHDLHVIRSIAHRCLVMQHGKIVEFGATEHVMTSPRHPYTQQLLDAAFPEERLQAIERDRLASISNRPVPRALRVDEPRAS